jgi:hypothetical protein
VTWVLLYPLSAAPIIWRTLAATELSVWSYVRSMMPALRASLVMVVMVLGVRWLTPGVWPLAVRFAISVLTGMLSYLAVMYIAERQRIGELFRLMRGEDV